MGTRRLLQQPAVVRSRPSAEQSHRRRGIIIREVDTAVGLIAVGGAAAAATPATATPTTASTSGGTGAAPISRGADLTEVERLSRGERGSLRGNLLPRIVRLAERRTTSARVRPAPLPFRVRDWACSSA